MSSTPSAVAAAAQMTPAQQDAFATSSILRNSILRSQVAGSPQTIYPASTPVITIQPTNVGLIKRFIVEVTGTISNTGSTTITLTDLGLMNLFSQVTYIDLNNQTRISTPSVHLALIASAKRRAPFGGTYDANQLTGNNRSEMQNVPPAYWPVFNAPATIASGASGNFTAFFEVPLAYSDTDLRGAVYASVLQAVQQLNFTPNAQAVTANPADDTFAVYSGAAGTAGNISAMSLTVTQEYFDNLPSSNGKLILPAYSVSQMYQLMNTPFQAIPQNQNYPISYANLRRFLSTFAIYNSTGASGGRTLGTDINYWNVQTANNTPLWQNNPMLCALLSREELHTDLPAGCYYFPTRKRPISTLQYGNVALNINASVASANSKLQIFWEMFADINTILNAGSLAAN